MLRFLRIEHLAVIESLEVEFEPGLNVLTGETGAGKSMLVEAVGLLKGGRSASDLVRTGEQQALVQAVFDSSPSELIVRREVTAQGRSRAFANDILITAAALKELTDPLIELHGQHEHQILLDAQSHLGLLDAFAGLEDRRALVSEAFRDVKLRQSEFDALQMDQRERAARIELLSFQLSELQNAQLRSGEDVELDTARRVLANAEKLQRWSAEAYEALYESEDAAMSRLAHVWKRVGELAGVDPQFQPYVDARDALKAQLEELAMALRAYREGIDASPQRLQEVEDRLALLERLKRKHGTTLDALIGKKNDLARQLESLQHADDRRADLAGELDRARDLFLTRARDLSRRRRESARLFASRLQRLLEELAMGKTVLEMRFSPELDEASWSETGVDSAECYLSANIGEEPRPLARIASGGELSRVMLAVRTLAAADTPGKTLIFDEIDAGIGGRVADVVGRKLRELGGIFQVLCITHLPQIAAAGHAHFQLSKHVSGGRTRTRVTRLDGGERVDEVARMIGGAALTDASRAAARELLRASQGESESRMKAKAKGARS